jgi:hypothetical protein
LKSSGRAASAGRVARISTTDTLVEADETGAKKCGWRIDFDFELHG